jgi:hypothetical protein
MEELFLARKLVTQKIIELSPNGGSNDANGALTKLKILKEEAERIESLIKYLVEKNVY